MLCVPLCLLTLTSTGTPSRVPTAVAPAFFFLHPYLLPQELSNNPSFLRIRVIKPAQCHLSVFSRCFFSFSSLAHFRSGVFDRRLQWNASTAVTPPSSRTTSFSHAPPGPPVSRSSRGPVDSLLFPLPTFHVVPSFHMGCDILCVDTGTLIPYLSLSSVPLPAQTRVAETGSGCQPQTSKLWFAPN